MAFTPYQVEKKINGTTYIAQFNGISAYNKAIDSSYISETSPNTSNEKLAEYLLKNVIVEPRLKLDDFGRDKVGTVEEKEINGKVYKAEFKGIRTALRAIDENYIGDSSNISSDKFAQYILDNIIVSPENMDIDDFESADEQSEVIAFAREVMQGGEVWEEYEAITGFAREVMQGNFRNKKNTTANKGKSAK